jgi:hypothetical protein
MGSDSDVYASLRRAFEELHARWYLFSGQAAIIHGATRFTEDIDITVDLGEKGQAALVKALGTQGLSMRVHDDDFIEQTRVLPVIHEASTIPVDIVLAGPGIEEMFFERVVSVDVEGQRVPVACAEDIVVMKVLSGRPKDLDDVGAIAAAQGDALDAGRVRKLLALLEEALDQSDLLPAFEACLARSREHS